MKNPILERTCPSQPSVTLTLRAVHVVFIDPVNNPQVLSGDTS